VVVGPGGWLLLPHIIYLLRAANNGGHGKEWGVERALLLIAIVDSVSFAAFFLMLLLVLFYYFCSLSCCCCPVLTICFSLYLNCFSNGFSFEQS